LRLEPWLTCKLLSRRLLNWHLLRWRLLHWSWRHLNWIRRLHLLPRCHLADCTQH
jgi:hypothetical protein